MVKRSMDVFLDDGSIFSEKCRQPSSNGHTSAHKIGDHPVENSHYNL